MALNVVHGEIAHSNPCRTARPLRLYPDGKSHEWMLLYDPAGGNGRGQISVSLDGQSCMLELAPDARFVEAVRERSVVLSGDVRLPENLQRAAIEQAVAFLACTNDDLTNVQSCLHARRLNPGIRTVARI